MNVYHEMVICNELPMLVLQQTQGTQFITSFFLSFINMFQNLSGWGKKGNASEIKKRYEVNR